MAKALLALIVSPIHAVAASIWLSSVESNELATLIKVNCELVKRFRSQHSI